MKITHLEGPGREFGRVLAYRGLEKAMEMGTSLHRGPVNPSAWRLLKPSSYCDVGRFFYRVFKFGTKLCRSLFKIM